MGCPSRLQGLSLQARYLPKDCSASHDAARRRLLSYIGHICALGLAAAGHSFTAGEESSAGVAVLLALEVSDVLMGLNDDVSSRPGLPASLDLSSLMLHEGRLPHQSKHSPQHSHEISWRACHLKSQYLTEPEEPHYCYRRT